MNRDIRMIMEVSNYKNIGKGCLVGSFDVTIPEWGLSIHECKLFEKDGRRWVGFPGRQYETSNGEKKHEDYVTMDKDRKAKFSAKCLEKLSTMMG